MDIFILASAVTLALVGLTLLANNARAKVSTEFELQKNCLLTRWPLLFITGPRSIFYFKSYWNIYTSFLAEHGYEVYILNLPWNKKEHRRRRFISFLEEQQKNKQLFHLIIDEATFLEFKDLLTDSSLDFISITRILDGKSANPIDKCDSRNARILFDFANSPDLLQRCLYRLHCYFIGNPLMPSLNSLGGNPRTQLSNSKFLLERSTALAELDLIENRQSHYANSYLPQIKTNDAMGT